jgi:hypothetical protein
MSRYKTTPDMEAFEAIAVSDVRRLVGGRRLFRNSASVTVHLPDGHDVDVALTSLPSNIPGRRVYFVCPRCESAVAVLRVVPGEGGLMCGKCLVRTFGAKYLSQRRGRAISCDTIPDAPPP